MIVKLSSAYSGILSTTRPPYRFHASDPSDLLLLVVRPLLRIGGALRAPRPRSLLRSQARCALTSGATPRLMGLRPQATWSRSVTVCASTYRVPPWHRHSWAGA